jgi:hypothetical protein
MARVTRLCEISPFGLLFKSPGLILAENGGYVGILKVQKGLDVVILDFQIENLGNFWFGNCFGYIFQNLGDIFPNHLVTLNNIYPSRTE